MSRQVPQVPRYGRHKATGQARVVLNGREHYLGRYGSAESRRRYEQLIAEWLAHGRMMPRTVEGAARITVSELLLAYLQFADRYYVKNGRPTKEQANIRQAVRPLMRLYSDMPVDSFGPLALKAVREVMIGLGWSRKYINDNVSRIRLMFKWGVGNELVLPTVSHGLQAVSGLRKGRSEARETGPVKPVMNEFIEAVRPHVSRQVWAMIQLQRLTGMRPGEVVIIRGRDIDRTSDLWEYRPESHKTEHHSHVRIIPLGLRSQQTLMPFLRPDPSLPVFSPLDAELERRTTVHLQRKTPLIAANSSTMLTHLNRGASYLVHGFYRRFMNKDGIASCLTTT